MKKMVFEILVKLISMHILDKSIDMVESNKYSSSNYKDTDTLLC